MTFNYNINENTRCKTKLFSSIGDRNSVGFSNIITVKNRINCTTEQFNPRILNIDQYRNYGIESRLITNYRPGNMKNTIVGGFSCIKIQHLAVQMQKIQRAQIMTRHPQQNITAILPSHPATQTFLQKIFFATQINLL